MLVTYIMLTVSAVTAKASSYYEMRHEGMENIYSLSGSTITMELGDRKTLYLGAPFGDDNKYEFDATKNYSWYSSDKSIVSMFRNWEIDPDGFRYDLRSCIIIAEKPGTAVITAESKGGHAISFNVNVKNPKSAATKKCKHKWKTVRRASCLASGVKSCKKCKLRKVIAKKDHNMEMESKKKVDYKYCAVYYCASCSNEDPEIRKKHNRSVEMCDEVCDATFSPLEYGSDEAARAAYNAHCRETGHEDPGDGWHYIEYPYEIDKITYHDVLTCTECYYTQKDFDLFYNVNDPDKIIWVKDY